MCERLYFDPIIVGKLNSISTFCRCSEWRLVLDTISDLLCRCLRSLALGLLDVLADCAQCHIVLLGDLRVGQTTVEVVGHQLLDASLPEPHQEAALLEVCPLPSLSAPSQCCL